MPFLVFPGFTLLVEVQDAKTIKKFKGYDDKKLNLPSFRFCRVPKAKNPKSRKVFFYFKT